MQGITDVDLQIAGIQHFSFCRRQWALIHIEQQWAENYFTADGNVFHERSDNPFNTEKRGNLIISRAIPIRSDRLGVSGTCDMVEFRVSSDGVPIAGRDGTWLPTPVEFKRGKSKEGDADKLQLCAQAICLEEMLCCPSIECAYLFYGTTRHREEVMLTDALREEVEKMLIEMRLLYERGHTPRVKTSKKCQSCSLRDICLPKLNKQRSAHEYNMGIWSDI